MRWCILVSPQEAVEGSVHCIRSGRGCGDLGEVAFGWWGRGFQGAWLPRRGAGWGGGTCLPPQEDEAAPAAAGVAGHRGPPPRAAASATVPSLGACSARSSREARRREREWGEGGGRTRAPEPCALPPPTRDPRGRARHPFVPGVPEGGGQQGARCTRCMPPPSR